MKKKKTMRVLLCVLIFLQLQACTVTLYNWSEIPEADAHYRYSEAEKRAHYRRYAIHSLESTSEGKAFKTLEQPDVLYSLNSYAPIIYQLTPEAKDHFLEAQNWDNKDNIPSWIFLATEVYAIYAAIKFGTLQEDYDAGNTSINIQAEKDHAITAAIVFLVASLGYLGLAIYVNHKKQEEYEKIKAAYNEALRKELGLSEAQVQDMMLPQTNPQ